MPLPKQTRHWLHWPGYLRNLGWRPLDLDSIPSYSQRHKKRQATLLMYSIGLLAGWVLAHQVVAPDIGRRSLIWLGGLVVPHSLAVWIAFQRLRPSWREYTAMYGIVVAYVPLQDLFSITQSDAGPYLLAGTCFLFLILSNLMMRFRFGNAVLTSLFITLLAVWFFPRQPDGPNLWLPFAFCAFAVASSTLYVNYLIANDEMHYVRLEQHFRLVLSLGTRDLWEFDSAAGVFKVRRWNADTSQPPSSYSYEKYLSLIHPDDRPPLVAAIRDSLEGRALRFQLEFRMGGAGQQDWRWFQLAGHAPEGRNGAVATRLIGTSCDVTERKCLYAQVEERSREVQQAAREKAEFLATMSHSIRTPLNAVIGATSVLATEPLSDEPRGMVDVIQQSGRLLLTVLNDVLDAKSPASQLLQAAPFNPHQVLRHCSELIGPMAIRKNLELRLAVAPEIRSALLGDAVRLQQVLINLLFNAVKFTPSGSISLSASAARPSEPSAELITFSVSDTGIGIEEQAQASLFARFEQVHTQNISGPAGSGLGLAISQRLVEAMGGVIECRSQPGAGSTFSFSLRFPVAEIAKSDPEDKPAAVQLDAVNPHPARVLVAEDNPVNRLVLARMLQRLNCEVEAVANGAEAVEACSQRSFDLIFMDCDMPVLNGMDATRSIRQLPRFAAVPIIAATAHALPSNLEACLDSGMSDALTKPVSLACLQAALARWRTSAAASGEECRSA